MTDDIPFYVELAREADGPVVELAVGNGRVAIPVAQATGRQVIGIDSSPAMLEQGRARGAEHRRGSRPARRRHARARARRAGGADLLPFPGAPAPADLVRPASYVRTCRGLPPYRAGGSPGTPSRSIIKSPPGWTDSTRKRRCRTRLGTRSATTESTSRSTTAPRARCGGRPRTNGSGCSTWQAAARGPLRRLRQRAAHRRQPRIRVRRAPPPRWAVQPIERQRVGAM